MLTEINTAASDTPHTKTMSDTNTSLYVPKFILIYSFIKNILSIFHN